MSTPLDHARGLSPALLARNRRGTRPWLCLAASMCIWIIPFAIAGAILSAIVTPFIAPFLLALLVYLVYRSVINARRRNGHLIVGYLDLAVRLNLPLVPFLDAARIAESGRRSLQLSRVARALAAGYSITDSLAQAEDVPDEVIARLHSAEPLGQVRSALRISVEEELRAADESTDLPDATLYRLYVALMLFLIPAVTMFIMIFVVPKFKEIFQDFRTTLPPLTRLVISISHFMSEDFGIVTALIFLAIALIALLFFSACATRVLLPSMPLPVIRPLVDWVAWRLPIARTLQRNRAMAETCALLGVSIRAGIPLPTAAQCALGLPVNNAFRLQLQTFHQRLLAGDTPAAAAQAAGLPPLMIGLLAPTAHRAPSPELFTFLEHYYRNCFSRLQIALRGAIGPIVVITVALIEGTIVVALFLPLVKLIESVSGGSDGGNL